MLLLTMMFLVAFSGTITAAAVPIAPPRVDNIVKSDNTTIKAVSVLSNITTDLELHNISFLNAEEYDYGDFTFPPGTSCGCSATVPDHIREDFHHLTDSEFEAFINSRPPTEEEIVLNEKLNFWPYGRVCEKDDDCVAFCRAWLEVGCVEKFGGGPEGWKGEWKGCECFKPGKGPKKEQEANEVS